MQGYTEAVDMWSAGVIIFILLAGYAPFDDENDVVLYQKIRRGEHDMGDSVWDVISPDARDLVVRALTASYCSTMLIIHVAAFAHHSTDGEGHDSAVVLPIITLLHRCQ